MSAVPVEALNGIRVIEAGPGNAISYAGKMFADLGAEVAKVEPAGGARERREGTLVDIGDGRLESPLFGWLNAEKTTVTSDAILPTDDPAVRRLLTDADVLLFARGPLRADDARATVARARTVNPALVAVSLSWFGDDGPYRDYLATDVTLRSLAGLVHLIGEQDRPTALSRHVGDVVGGVAAFTAAMAGLCAAEGGGRHFSVSHLEALAALSDPMSAGSVGPGTMQRLGVHGIVSPPGGIFPTREGLIAVAALTRQQWVSFCDMFELGVEVMDDPRFYTREGRSRHTAEFVQEIWPLYAPKLLTRSAAEWFEAALKRRLPFAIVPTMAELLRQDVHRDTGAFQRVCMDKASFEGPATGLRLTATPTRAEVRASLPVDPGRVEWRARAARAKARPRATGKPPLAHLRIVDFSMGWAGPLVTRQLADLGADVIKIESAGHFDWWRGTDTRPSFVASHGHEKDHNYIVMNRNKRGIAIDLASPAGAALARRLVAKADAVVENFSRDVMPKLGLDYPALNAVNPTLVMLSMPAFPAGRWGSARAYGYTLEQASGLPTVSGTEGGPPMMNHLAFGDPVGGLNATAALLAALRHRSVTGEGQLIDMSAVQSVLPYVAPWLIEQSATGAPGPRTGGRHPFQAPHGCFRCAGDDAWVWVAVTDDAMWARLCAALDRSDWADRADLAALEGRQAAAAELERGIEDWTAQRSPDKAMQALQAAGVAAGAVRSPYMLGTEPQLVARGFWTTAERPHSGPHILPALPIREDGQRMPVRRPAPLLGQDTDEVLRNVLGLSEPEVAALHAQGVLASDPPGKTSVGAA